MQPLVVISGGVAALISYIWVASYIWHVLPTPKDTWWGTAAFLTTIVLGLASLFAGVCVAAFFASK